MAVWVTEVKSRLTVTFNSSNAGDGVVVDAYLLQVYKSERFSWQSEIQMFLLISGSHICMQF